MNTTAITRDVLRLVSGVYAVCETCFGAERPAGEGWKWSDIQRCWSRPVVETPFSAHGQETQAFNWALRNGHLGAPDDSSVPAFEHRPRLFDFATSKELRLASPEERAACILAAESDPTGIGAFEVEGRLCFVV